MPNTTKQALEESLKHMLLKKPLDKITIRDITEDCGISRMAFYYHFQDIYDLVEWACIEDASKALQGKKTYETWQEGLLRGGAGKQALHPQRLPLYQPGADGAVPLPADLWPDPGRGGRAEPGDGHL